jgi:hypothetical protein
MTSLVFATYALVMHSSSVKCSDPTVAKRTRQAVFSNKTVRGHGIQDIKDYIDLLQTSLHGNSSEVYFELPLWDEDTGKDDIVNISVQVHAAPLADLPIGAHPSYNRSVRTTSSYLFELHDASQDDEVYSSGVLKCAGSDNAENTTCEVIESSPGRRLRHSWKQVLEVVCLPFYICGSEIDPSCTTRSGADQQDWSQGQQACCPYTNQVWCQWAVIKVWKWVRSCFPADSFVQTPIGQKLISEVRVGDLVLTPSGFDTVYFNSHADEGVLTPYLRFKLSTGARAREVKFLRLPEAITPLQMATTASHAMSQ